MFGLFRKTNWPQLTFDEIKKRARILVIDDNDFPYQELFEREGYSIDKWEDIIDLQKLEDGYYDIILLDIQGVGASHTEEQGFGILKHLRSTSPTQIVIAYSNSDWSLKYQEFFDLADSRLDKRADYVEFKRTVDSLLRERFSLGFYINRIEKALGDSVSDREKLRKLVEKSVHNKATNQLSKYLNAHVLDKDKVQIALNIAQVAIGIASL